MNRRSFITRLASGLVGVSLIDVEWVPTAIAAPLQADLSTLDGVTAEVLRLMTQRIDGFRAAFIPGQHTLGERGMTHQWHVQMTPRSSVYEVDSRRDLEPAAAYLAQEARDWHQFGALPIALFGAEGALAVDGVTGIAVRGIRQYDVQTDMMYDRFDIFGSRH